MGLSHWCRYALASAVIRSTCLKPKNEQKRKHHQAKSCTCRLEHAGCKRDEQMSRFVLVCVCVCFLRLLFVCGCVREHTEDEILTCTIPVGNREHLRVGIYESCKDGHTDSMKTQQNMLH